MIGALANGNTVYAIENDRHQFELTKARVKAAHEDHSRLLLARTGDALTASVHSLQLVATPHPPELVYHYFVKPDPVAAAEESPVVPVKTSRKPGSRKKKDDSQADIESKQAEEQDSSPRCAKCSSVIPEDTPECCVCQGRECEPCRRSWPRSDTCSEECAIEAASAS